MRGLQIANNSSVCEPWALATGPSFRQQNPVDVGRGFHARCSPGGWILPSAAL